VAELIVMTRSDLASELGVQPIVVRRVLRRLYPRSPVEKGQRWTLTQEMAAAVRQHLKAI
jgi:hypothetical protein